MAVINVTYVYTGSNETVSKKSIVTELQGFLSSCVYFTWYFWIFNQRDVWVRGKGVPLELQINLASHQVNQKLYKMRDMFASRQNGHMRILISCKSDAIYSPHHTHGYFWRDLNSQVCPHMITVNFDLGEAIQYPKLIKAIQIFNILYQKILFR